MRERLDAQQQHAKGLSQIILNPQMRLVLEQGADHCCKNLPTSDKVAVIILDKYSNLSCYNIILVEYSSLDY